MTTGPQSASHGPTTIRWGILGLAFLTVLIDGFDTAALAASLPTIAQDWGVPSGAFTYPLVLTNLGVVGGYLMAGPVGAALGRKNLLVGGVAMCSAMTLLSAAVLPLESMVVLSVVRLAAGVAIGVVLPVAVSMGTDMTPERYRQRVSVSVTLGLASGLTVGGVFGRLLLERFGSGGMFWAGGLVALPLVVALVVVMEEPPGVGSRAQTKDAAKVSRLIDPGLRLETTLLWAFAFFVFIGAYTLTSWVPTLLLDYGFAASETPVGLAFLSFGGVLGGLVLIPLTGRVGISAGLVVMTALGVLCMVIVGFTSFGSWAVLLLLIGAGAGTTAGQIGQLTMAVSIYPPGARTTGVGTAAAIGRIGSIVGPGVAGVLIALRMESSTIIVLAAVPVALACAAAMVLAGPDRGERSPAEGTGPAGHRP